MRELTLNLIYKQTNILCILNSVTKLKNGIKVVKNETVYHRKIMADQTYDW